MHFAEGEDRGVIVLMAEALVDAAMVASMLFLVMVLLL